jgi:hypothetical protein
MNGCEIDREYSNGGERRNAYENVIGEPEGGRRDYLGCLGRLAVSD